MSSTYGRLTSQTQHTSGELWICGDRIRSLLYNQVRDVIYNSGGGGSMNRGVSMFIIVGGGGSMNRGVSIFIIVGGGGKYEQGCVYIYNSGGGGKYEQGCVYDL